MKLIPISKFIIETTKTYLVYDQRDGYAVATAYVHDRGIDWSICVKSESDFSLYHVTHIAVLPEIHPNHPEYQA
jgi:hypothetical protein